MPTVLEAIDNILGFILWLSGYFCIPLVLFTFFGLLSNIADKFDNYKNPKLWAQTLGIFSGIGMCLTIIVLYIFPYIIAEWVNNILFGGGDMRFSVAFNHVVGFISQWVKSPTGAIAISAISFIAWFLGLIASIISIYEFFKKRVLKMST
jgi:hypothetical protein